MHTLYGESAILINDLSDVVLENNHYSENKLNIRVKKKHTLKRREN